MLLHLFHWFLHVTGADNVSGSEYGFWSGFGSDLGEIALLAGLYSIMRKHNCHVKGCWRIGLHIVNGTPYITCRKHHPDLHTGDITASNIKAAYDSNSSLDGNLWS